MTPFALIERPLRLAGTAFAFAVFGLGGLLYRFPVAPLLNLDRDAVRRHRRARRIVQWWFARFVGLLKILHLVRIRVVHPERLSRPGLLVTANHPSLIDVVCLMSLIPYGTTVVKDSLTRNPFTAAPIRAAGYLSNACGVEALEAVSEELQRGASMVIFPEGTRTPTDLPAGTYPRMHRGAAALAFETGRPLTPVRVTAQPRWLTKDRGWWHLPPEPMTLTFEILEDLPLEDLQDLYNQRPSLACRRLTVRLQQVLFS
ncbi:MAG: lysophospholipid acyltransferase family protein [Sutterella sp.]|nr:lysophospholipid acyltransferase family protein [Sutterella sp.]